MKLQLNTNCFELSIDSPSCCNDNGNPTPPEPNVPYTPENAANPYDEAGQVHNQVIRQLREMRAKKGMKNEQIMETAIKLVNTTKFKTKAMQSLKPGNVGVIKETFLKYGIIDGCFPFPWPWLPGGGEFGFPLPFPNSGNHLRTIDPIDLIFILIKALKEGRVPIQLKTEIVDWENKVTNADISEEVRTACLMNASIARYSLALADDATGGGSSTAGKKVNPWWSAVADGVGGLVGSLGGGLGTLVGAAAASGVADAVIDKVNED